MQLYFFFVGLLLFTSVEFGHQLLIGGDNENKDDSSLANTETDDLEANADDLRSEPNGMENIDFEQTQAGEDPNPLYSIQDKRSPRNPYSWLAYEQPLSHDFHSYGGGGDGWFSRRLRPFTTFASNNKRMNYFGEPVYSYSTNWKRSNRNPYSWMN